jgi:diaminopimelate decarboxylase
VSAPFAYQGGRLHAEGVALAEIAAAVGTPAYVYSGNAMRARFRRLRDAFAGQPATICYAIKANSTLAVIRTLAEEGAGAEIVSAGELHRALAAGVRPGRIVFAGVGKSRDEMILALETGIAQFNVESVPELIVLGEVAAAHRLRAPVALRVNPDISAGTHDKITTGRRQDKFGIAYDQAAAVYAMAHRLAGIELVGLHLHIGSQILSLAPFEAAYERGAELIRTLRADGIALGRLDLGGGLGISYRGDPVPTVEDYAAMVRRVTEDLGVELVLEPGRFLVAEAGLLLARVLYIKDGADRPCVILDAGMNDLIRPALYDAYHEILPVAAPAAETALRPVDVVGPICESSDIFARSRPLPPLAADDLVAFLCAGAYCAAMALDYNSRPVAAQVLVEDGRFAVVRPRVEPSRRLEEEQLPAWMTAPPIERGATG